MKKVLWVLVMLIFAGIVRGQDKGFEKEYEIYNKLLAKYMMLAKEVTIYDDGMIMIDFKNSTEYYSERQETFEKYTTHRITEEVQTVYLDIYEVSFLTMQKYKNGYYVLFATANVKQSHKDKWKNKIILKNYE